MTIATTDELSASRLDRHREPALPMSPFDRALSPADREMLAPVLARQYIGPEAVTLTGVMTRVWRRHRWLSLALRVLVPLGILFPETGHDVPTTLRIAPARDGAGRPIQGWRRTFSFPRATRRLDGVVTWDERLGEVVERFGPGGMVGSTFRVTVRPDGLRIEATRMILQLGRWHLYLPRALAATAVVDQRADATDPAVTHVDVRISHALLGHLLCYSGTLRIATDGRPAPDGDRPTGRISAVTRRLLDLAPKHPVGMTTDYRTVALINYAVEPRVLRRLVPDPLELDVVHDHGYITVVCADMVRMRPSPVPSALGITYDQVVYRVPVRYRGEPGLYFLGSDAANPLMVAAGAAFSMFGVRLSRTSITDAGDRVTIDVFGRGAGVDLHAYLKVEPAAGSLPAGSVFSSKGEAQAFLVDRFVAFVPGIDGRPMRRVRVRRGTWDVLLPSATDVRSDILDGSSDLPAGSARLDNTMVARAIPYHWYAAEVEGSAGAWHRPLLSVPD